MHVFPKTFFVYRGAVLLAYFGPQKFFETKEWWSKKLSDGWWGDMLMDLMQWDTFFVGLGALGVLYRTSGLWGKLLLSLRGKKNEYQESNIPTYQETPRTTESENIKESILQRKPVDRRPLDHAYRILRYMGVYQGEGDERAGISNMLRQAALDGDITMWGVEIANQSLDRCVLLKIPPDYWTNYAIDETGFEKSVFVGPDSTPPKTVLAFARRYG